MNLRSDRNTLGISQSRLARLSGVSRFQICTYELGDGSLTPEEQARIHAALISEAERLRNIAIQFGQTEPIASAVGVGAR
jgi:predicted transcriptional regulator